MSGRAGSARKRSIAHDVYDLLCELGEGAGVFTVADIKHRMPWYSGTQISAALCRLRDDGTLDSKLVHRQGKPPINRYTVRDLSTPHTFKRGMPEGLKRPGRKSRKAGVPHVSKRRRKTVENKDQRELPLDTYTQRLNAIVEELLTLTARVEELKLEYVSELELRRELKRRQKDGGAQ